MGHDQISWCLLSLVSLSLSRSLVLHFSFSFYIYFKIFFFGTFPSACKAISAVIKTNREHGRYFSPLLQFVLVSACVSYTSFPAWSVLPCLMIASSFCALWKVE
jgi:hypothetical protein